MTEKDTLQKSTENHRFRLAILFIGGFLIIMFAALVGEFLGVYDSLKDLAAIFSGWITAVMGFYFLQQNTEKAQQQTIEITKDASEARKTSELAVKKTAKLTSVSRLNILDIKETIGKQEENMKKQRATIEKQNIFINELISKLEELGTK